MSCFTDIENKPDDWLVLDPLTIQKPIPKTGCDTNLIVQNYLSEFKTDAQKQKVKDNLGLYVDNILSSESTNPVANKTVHQELNKLKEYVSNDNICEIDINYRRNDLELIIEKKDGSKESKFIGCADKSCSGLMSPLDKKKLDKLNAEGSSYDLNTYINEGVYIIETMNNEALNYPIQTPQYSTLRLSVLQSYDGSESVIVQVLNINNNAGGEGGIYIRSCQDDIWKPWSKLQTNMEVGLINQQQMDSLIDNGIYSGILQSTGETFVIICINNYAIAQQVGIQHISQLKYSLVVGTGEVKIEKRTRDAYGFWTEWVNLNDSKKEKVKIVQQSDFNATINPNVFYLWGTASTLEIELGDPLDGEVSEYMFQFTSGATATTLILPDTIQWASKPSIQPNKTYQVSIINNLGVIGEFGNE